MSTLDIPGYAISRPIDTGGMATVYQAVQKSLSRQVAIKVMDECLNKDQNFIERFEQARRKHHEESTVLGLEAHCVVLRTREDVEFHRNLETKRLDARVRVTLDIGCHPCRQAD